MPGGCLYGRSHRIRSRRYWWRQAMVRSTLRRPSPGPQGTPRRAMAGRIPRTRRSRRGRGRLGLVRLWAPLSARTWEESAIARARSSGLGAQSPASSSSCTRSHTPAVCQSGSRSGRHGHRMAVIPANGVGVGRLAAAVGCAPHSSSLTIRLSICASRWLRSSTAARFPTRRRRPSPNEPRTSLDTPENTQ